jgi:hypothetical protein
LSEHHRVTRRGFLKRAAVVGGAVSGAAALGVGGKATLDYQAHAQELARRDQERPRAGGRWFTAHEYVLVGVLAALIVPSDETGPGAPEAGVADTLDGWLASSQKVRGLYASGLLAFDELAESEYGRQFTELERTEQTRLMHLVDQTYQQTKYAEGSTADKVRRKLARVYYSWPAPGAWGGMGAAVDLFPQLVQDTMMAFYTNQVAWEWLGYDGPPFPRGYIGRLGECH